MDIRYITYPGRDLDTHSYDNDLAEIHNGLEALQSCVDDLHVSLSNYLRGKEIQIKVSAYNRNKICGRSADVNSISNLSETELKYHRRHVYIHGHSFVYSLDKYYKILKGMKKIETIAKTAEVAVQEFESFFPAITAVRNSAQHFEDRYKLKSRNKTITPKPFSVGGFESPNGNVFVVSSFFNDQLSYTSADGTLGVVEISQESLDSAANNFQAFLNGLLWHGPSYVHPE